MSPTSVPQVMIKFIQGDCLSVLRTLPAESVNCCVTSPPYYNLRSYLGEDHADKHHEIGGEASPAAYVANLVAVFREVRRVLRYDGCAFIVIGDSYAGGAGGRGDAGRQIVRYTSAGGSTSLKHDGIRIKRGGAGLLKPKDLIGIPWRLALALQAGFSTCTCGVEMRTDLWPVQNGHMVCIECLLAGRIDSKIVETEKGWWLRSECIWSKPSPMPESVTDRPTRAHEQVFLLTKSAKYFWDSDAVKEDSSCFGRQHTTGVQPPKVRALQDSGCHGKGGNLSINYERLRRNLRSVWTIASQPFPGSHFATMPPKLAETCIKAGTSERGVCRQCGAPWARVVERTSMVVREGPGRRGLQFSSTGSSARTACTGTMLAPPSSTTIGFRQSCSCPSSDPIPATVLDPFAGSGTTGLVSDRLQRNAILIDLSDEYEKMARERIQDDAPLFAEFT